MTIALFGATGQLGGYLIEALLSRGVVPGQIRALGRNDHRLAELRTRGLDARRVDLQQQTDVESAVAGVDTVMLISGSDNGVRVQQHRTVVDAAVAADVSLLVYTSAPKATTSDLVLAPDHKATEELIAAAGLPSTILRNGWYTENYRDSFDQARSTGRISNCVGDGRVASATRQDYAQAAAVVLSTSGHAGTVYELTGDVAWSFGDFAATAARVLGSAVEYVQLTPEQERSQLREQGLDEQTADFVVALDGNTRDGLLGDTSGQLAELIGRPTTPLEATLRGWA
jgi:NAD(P)H dehydrogenase (quinone)